MNAQLHNFCLSIGWQLLFHGPRKVENKMKQTDLAKHNLSAVNVNALWVCDEQKCTRKWLKWNCILKPVNKLCACSDETEARVVWNVRKKRYLDIYCVWVIIWGKCYMYCTGHYSGVRGTTQHLRILQSPGCPGPGCCHQSSLSVSVGQDPGNTRPGPTPG